MSISEREQQTLDFIEHDLASSGPKLASMLATFTRLAADEEMPVREAVRRVVKPPSAVRARAHADLAAASPRRIPTRLSRRAAWQLLWLAGAIALVVLALVFGQGTGQRICTVSMTAACQQAAAPSPSGASQGVPRG